jgi:effector-binding domain-containing protein
MAMAAVDLKRADALYVIAVRDVFDDYRDIRMLFDEVESYLQAYHVEPAGPRIALFYDTAEDGDIEGAAAIPVPLSFNEEPPEDERLMREQLPAVETLACLTHDGDYDSLDDTFHALLDWAKQNGYRAIGPRRVVVQDDRMEMQLPVQSVGEGGVEE